MILCMLLNCMSVELLLLKPGGAVICEMLIVLYERMASSSVLASLEISKMGLYDVQSFFVFFGLVIMLANFHISDMRC